MTRRGCIGLLAPSMLLGQQRAPYVDKSREPLVYAGPGRDEGAGDAADVRIGFFGPGDAAHAQGGALWMGLSLAIEDANRLGGYQGKLFRVIPRWSDDPWRSGASAVVRLAYEDRVCAVVGGIDGATTHLAAQVVAKAMLPLIDAASTDQTVNGARVPWIFSRAPSDPQIARFLADALNGEPCVLIAGTDHDSRNLATEFVKELARRKQHPLRRFGPTGWEMPEGASAAVVLAQASDSAKVVNALPVGARILAGPAAASRQFAAAVRGRTVIVPRLHALDAALAARLEARFGQRADEFSLLAYDAATVLVQAIREAGLNRALIRDRLARHFGPNGRQEVSL